MWAGAILLQGLRTNRPCLENLTEKSGKACCGSSISATNSEGEIERLLLRILFKKDIFVGKAYSHNKHKINKDKKKKCQFSKYVFSQEPILVCECSY